MGVQLEETMKQSSVLSASFLFFFRGVRDKRRLAMFVYIFPMNPARLFVLTVDKEPDSWTGVNIIKKNANIMHTELC